MSNEKNMLRLDRFLGNLGYGTRKEIKKFIKEGRIKVDNTTIFRPEFKVSTVDNVVSLDDQIIEYKSNVYLIMNKPAGVISATSDPYGEEITVIDLLEDDYYFLGLSPIGRLDKNTVGLIMLTNDGKYNHMMTSPKRGIFKTYYAIVKGKYNIKDKEKFINGIILEDGYKCKPAELYKLDEYVQKTNSDNIIDLSREFLDYKTQSLLQEDNYYESIIRITEGKYHQVKRMFSMLDQEIIYLKRITFGEFQLPFGLKEGEVVEVFPN